MTPDYDYTQLRLLLLLTPVNNHIESGVQIYVINISKTLWLKITPALDPMSIKNIHSFSWWILWSYTCFLGKTLTPHSTTQGFHKIFAIKFKDFLRLFKDISRIFIPFSDYSFYNFQVSIILAFSTIIVSLYLSSTHSCISLSSLTPCSLNCTSMWYTLKLWYAS